MTEHTPAAGTAKPRPGPGPGRPALELPSPWDAPAAARTTARRPWLVAVVALSVAVVVLATAVVVGALMLSDRDDSLDALRARQADGAAALTVAKKWAVTFGAYDYQHLDAEFAATARYMTPQFAADYEKTTTALKQTFVAYKTTVSASLVQAAVISASSDSAQVLVLLDQTVTSNQSSTPTISRNRLLVELKRIRGAWLVATSKTT